MWSLERIEQYINDGVEENIHLDYKGSGSIAKISEKKKEISKDVSAFANSDGGVIIYGIREYDDKDKNHLPEKIDPINGNDYSKEWLEQIINSNISPKIHNILITPIQVGKKEDNRVIYVVEIPKSNTAHQMMDKKYYRRYNFQSIPMDDWEIKDIINRQSKTQVRLILDILPPKKLLHTPPFPEIILIKVWAFNSGNKVIKYLDCYLSGDSEAAKNIIKPRVNGNFEEYYSNLVEREANIGGENIIINSERAVILPNTSRHIATIELKGDFLKDEPVLEFHVSTEDNVKRFDFKGKEILN